MKTRASLIITIPIAFFLAAFFVLVVAPLFNKHSPTPFAKATGTDLGSLSNYAWSDNLGWISFSGVAADSSSYGVAIKSDYTLYGYAWSENVGWISFNAADTASCGFGTATLSGTNITGGAKVLSADNNGWNGCISLSGSSPSYGVTLPGGIATSGLLDGYAWADSTVGGWISFNCDTGGPTYQADGVTVKNAATNICGNGVNQNNYAVTYTVGAAPPPTPSTVTLSGPARVRKGATATLTYTVTYTTAPSSCVVTGTNAYNSGALTIPASGVQGTVSPSPTINANTLFTLTCDGVSATKTVGITPTIIEK